MVIVNLYWQNLNTIFVPSILRQDVGIIQFLLLDASFNKLQLLQRDKIK